MDDSQSLGGMIGMAGPLLRVVSAKHAGDTCQDADMVVTDRGDTSGCRARVNGSAEDGQRSDLSLIVGEGELQQDEPEQVAL
jgi:hypothetical protein